VSPPRQSAVGEHPMHVTITNNGDVKVNVSTFILNRHSSGKGCALGNGTPKVKVSPSTFTLKPHHSEVTTVRLTQGIAPGEYVVVYEGSAVVRVTTNTGTGTATVNGAVGAEVVSKGASACIPPAPKADPPHHATTLSSTTILIVVVAIAVISILAAFIHRARHPRHWPPERELHHNG
jgi:hypothetical protein